MTTEAPWSDRRAAGPGRVAAWTRFAAVLTALVLVLAVLFPASADAAEAPVDLGTAASFSVLGGQTVTNTGSTQLGGDLGVSPGTAITGAPVVLGTTHAADAVAL